MLEWTGNLVPQGLLVKGAPWPGYLVVHPTAAQVLCCVFFFTGVKNGWRFAWQTMMKELAPQTADGSYSRPSYDFQAQIGDANFPVSFHN